MGPKRVKLFKRSDLDAWDAQRKAYHATSRRKVESAQEANQRLKAENAALKALVKDQKVLMRRIKATDRKLKEALEDVAYERAQKDRLLVSTEMLADFNRRLQAELDKAEQPPKNADAATELQAGVAGVEAPPKVSAVQRRVAVLRAQVLSAPGRRVAEALVERGAALEPAPPEVIADLIETLDDRHEDLEHLEQLSALTWGCPGRDDGFEDVWGACADIAARLGWWLPFETSPVMNGAARATAFEQKALFMAITLPQDRERLLGMAERSFKEALAKAALDRRLHNE